MDNDGIIERLRATIKEAGLSQAAFARRVGIDAGNMSKYLSGKLPVSPGLLNRVALEMGIDHRWLALGEGQPMAAAAAEGDALAAPSPAGAPVYDIDVTAGPMELERELTRDNIVGYVNLPGVDPRWPLVHVSGDSMQPVIADGALISIRPVTVCRDIFWGHIYVVVLDDYRMVKYVRRHPSNPDCVVLHSANPHYDDMDVALGSIRNLFLVQDILNLNRRY